MKPLIAPLIKRNAIVAFGFMLLLSVFDLVRVSYTPPWQILPFVLLGGCLWANFPLFKFQRPVLATLMSIVLVFLLWIPVAFGSRLISRTVETRAYQAQGYIMVIGCNGGAAGEASGQIHTIKQDLEILIGDNNTNTQLIAELQRILPIAEEKERVLSADCGKRGHRETYPWKTNWAEIRRVIKASEEEMSK